MSRTDLGSLLAHIDDPSTLDGWSYARVIADRAGISRRAISQKLVALEQKGFVESKPSGERPSIRSDAPPRLWRRKR